MHRRGTTSLAALIAASVALLAPLSSALALPAFPGAEGFGSDTPGGRGGRVIEVTTLESDGPGSLREACAAEGPRIIVFRVGGLIDLHGGLYVGKPYITIAGQTAPGDGICLANGPLVVGTHDVVIRHLRVRVGDGPRGGNPENRDGIGISGEAEKVYNVVVDHCSVSWGIDENIQTWYGPRDITIQWCITSESLHDSLHPKGPHGMGMILGNRGNTITVHHCLFAHNNGRNPLVNDGSKISPEPAIVDFRNNLVYNHGPWGCSNFDGNKRANYVGNYIKMGPDGLAGSPRALQLSDNGAKLVFVKDNIWPRHPDWEGDVEDWMVIGPSQEPPPEGLLSPTPIPAPPVTTEPAAEVYEAVRSFVGAILPVRDVVDARIVEEVRNGDGRIIHTQAEVGGWPEYASAEPPSDTDHDGMPDEWEEQHGLSPDDPADGPADLDGDGYTNVEEFLNGTHPAEKTSGAPIPQSEPEVQGGNDHLRYGVARAAPEPTVYDAASREAFVNDVKASGREVADYLGIEFVPIAPGGFTRGQIQVTLTKPFEMATCEITQAQWTAVIGTKPWLDQVWAQDAPENAASYVSWHDCQEFLARLNACGEREYRLPTQCEWELACRAGSTGESVFWFDEEQLDEFAWYSDNTYRGGHDEPYAHPVAQKRPNASGLYDMAGNVHEWCHDWYDYWYWNAERMGPTKTDPMGAEPGIYYKEYHVLRGGSFYRRSGSILARTASIHRPEYRNFDVGFRVVRLAP